MEKIKKKDHTIVVTGISSFVGVHLAVRMAHCARVIGTVTKDPCQYSGIQKKRLAHAVQAGVVIKTLDYTNEKMCRQFIRSNKPYLWFHHGGYAENYSSLDYDIRKGFAVNVQPLRWIIPLLKENGGQGLIITGSSAEYTSGNTLSKETEMCAPDTPYGVCKLAANLHARLLALQHGFPVRAIRIFIPYGKLDAPEKLIPSAVRSLIKNEPIDLSPCMQKRDFLHITDVCEGYAAAALDITRRPGVLYDIFNIASGKGVPLRMMLKKTASLMKKNPALFRFGARPMRAGETLFSAADIRKAEQILNFRPRPLVSGLKKYLKDY